jgi:radical SAM protein with 4Fe4S-binding SPASM domain
MGRALAHHCQRYGRPSAARRKEPLMKPTYIEIEPTKGCNLRCRMCHVSFMKEPLEYLDLDRVDFSFLEPGTLVTLGAVFEPCIHPQINKLIDILNRRGCRIVLITNGHNLHKKEIPALFDANLEMVTFSFDGISKETYELIRVGGNYERTLDNIENFRAAFSGSAATFAVNFTVLRCNLHEVADAPAFWDKRDFDVLRFIAMNVREPDEFILRNSLWEVRQDYFDALDTAASYVQQTRSRLCLASAYYQFKRGIENGLIASPHPQSKRPRIYPREHQYGADFGMTFPCKSPFVAARILWNGAVALCHNQPVGNLYEIPFETLWNSRQAWKLRTLVRMSDALCNKCDYFRLCLNSHFIDLDKIENYYSQPMLEKFARARSAASSAPAKATSA